MTSTSRLECLESILEFFTECSFYSYAEGIRQYSHVLCFTFDVINSQCCPPGLCIFLTPSKIVLWDKWAAVWRESTSCFSSGASRVVYFYSGAQDSATYSCITLCKLACQWPPIHGVFMSAEAPLYVEGTGDRVIMANESFAQRGEAALIISPGRLNFPFFTWVSHTIILNDVPKASVWYWQSQLSRIFWLCSPGWVLWAELTYSGCSKRA